MELSWEKSLSQSRRLPLLQVVSNNKSFSVGVQSPTDINAPRGCAEEKHANVIVFEYLETKGKISGRKKQKLHLWRKRDIQKRCEHQAHRRGMHISRICAWNTSRLAYDDLGTVVRDPGITVSVHSRMEKDITVIFRYPIILEQDILSGNS